MTMKNFTVTFSLNDEPAENWAESLGITKESAFEMIKKVREAGLEYIDIERKAGKHSADGSQMIVWLLENDRIDPRAFIMIFSRGLINLVNPPELGLLGGLLKGLGD